MEVLEEGHIIGNVTNPPGLLIVHEGAVIEGQCFTETVPGTVKAPASIKQLSGPKPAQSPKKLEDAAKIAKNKSETLAEIRSSS